MKIKHLHKIKKKLWKFLDRLLSYTQPNIYCKVHTFSFSISSVNFKRNLNNIQRWEYNTNAESGTPNHRYFWLTLKEGVALQNNT